MRCVLKDHVERLTLKTRPVHGRHSRTTIVRVVYNVAVVDANRRLRLGRSLLRQVTITIIRPIVGFLQ